MGFICLCFHDSGLYYYHISNGYYTDKSWDYSKSLPSGYTVITFKQFKDHILMKKKIIRYKLKDSCVKYSEPAVIICGCKPGDKLLGDVGSPEDIIKLKDAGILDLWFDPIYAPEYSLSRINGYDGKKASNDIVKYGCVSFDIRTLIDILNLKDISSDRIISSITLSSNITITMKEIKQIVDYFNHNK